MISPSLLDLSKEITMHTVGVKWVGTRLPASALLTLSFCAPGCSQCMMTEPCLSHARHEQLSELWAIILYPWLIEREINVKCNNASQWTVTRYVSRCSFKHAHAGDCYTHKLQQVAAQSIHWNFSSSISRHTLSTCKKHLTVLSDFGYAKNTVHSSR